MNTGRIAELSRRGVVAVSGPDTATFLNDLFTSDIPAAPGAGAYGGLLSPQGKVLFDFIAYNGGSRILIDLPHTLVADFVKRLGFYRLRAKVEIADISDDHIVVAAWGTSTAPILDGVVIPDPRLAALGWRAVVPAGADMAPDYTEATEAEYDGHRIALGVPEGGIDFAFGDAFPHDADMDQLGGVDFTKGCFIGQEVVSRMEHRGTARRRFVIAAGASPLPEAGTALTAGDRPIGTLGSRDGSSGIALVRLDRAKAAMDAQTPITAAGAALTLTLPPWAKFGWPSATAASED